MIPTDEAILTFMKAYCKRYGNGPLLKEIVARTPLTNRNSVFYAMQRLADAGHIKVVKPKGYSRRYEAA